MHAPVQHAPSTSGRKPFEQVGGGIGQLAVTGSQFFLATEHDPNTHATSSI
jgi:hypothetical protein